MNIKILFYSTILLTACDNIIDTKSLSKNISDESIKTFTEPIHNEINPIPLKVQPKENPIVIPERFKKKVSLVLNESIPIKSVLYEIASKLNINMQIDPTIASHIIFRANNKPFIEVIDAICDIADLRYTIQSDFLKIVKDTPYACNYSVQFLNLSRDSENKIAIATEINGNKIDNSSSINSSDSTVTVKAKSDFWSELGEGIRIILGNNPENKYSINKQSGIITVYANSRTQKDIKKYIDDIKEVNSSQVLIEAKIIEVVLKNEYKRGINWNILFNNGSFTSNYADNTNDMPTFSYRISNVDNILKALEKFGSIRTISNPRITAMNNQAAVLKIAENHVYFKLNYDKSYLSKDSSREDINVSSDIKTIPIGLVMFVQPSIDVKNKTISLFLRPTITKMEDSVNDPAVDIAIKSIRNTRHNNNYSPSKVPITEVREVASVLKLHDGEVAVLGGFMEVLSTKHKSGLPLVRDVPILGEAASDYGIKDQVIELVILVKVRISNPTTLQKAADIRLQRFVPDPRPF